MTDHAAITPAAPAGLSGGMFRRIGPGEPDWTAWRDLATGTACTTARAEELRSTQHHRAPGRWRAWLCGPAAASRRRPATRLAVVAVACLAGIVALALVKVAAIAHVLVPLADVGGNVNPAGAASAGAAGAGAAGVASSGAGSGNGGGSHGGDGEGGGESVTSHMVWHAVTDGLFTVLEHFAGEGAGLYGEVVTGMEAVATGAEGYLVVKQSPMAAQTTSTSGQTVSRYPGCDPQFPEQCERPGALLPKGHF
jgi:hypothetical protein